MSLKFVKGFADEFWVFSTDGYEGSMLPGGEKYGFSHLTILADLSGIILRESEAQNQGAIPTPVVNPNPHHPDAWILLE